MRSVLVGVTMLVAAACGACGDDDGVNPDATPPPDIDNGSCGSELRFTGEYVDWDTDESFCGIAEALVVAQSGGAMDTTAPNGRFDLCIGRAQEQQNLDVTPPTTDSQCTVPPSSYPLPGILVANKSVILAGGEFSGRNMTAARQATFFAEIGIAFDATKAQVHVHVQGTPRPVALEAAHGPVQAVAATTWAAGDTGHEVFFPNVEVGGGTTQLSVTGSAIGTGTIPLAAGKITSLTIITN